jgi:hypothetical protein
MESSQGDNKSPEIFYSKNKNSPLIRYKTILCTSRFKLSMFAPGTRMRKLGQMKRLLHRTKCPRLISVMQQLG